MSDTATLYLIRRAVCAHYKITNADLVGRSSVRNIAWPRQVAMMLAREMTAMSLPMIGRRFNRDHTTVLHAIRAVGMRAAKNSYYAEQFETIRANVVAAQENIATDELFQTFAAIDGVSRFLSALPWRAPMRSVKYRWGNARQPREVVTAEFYYCEETGAITVMVM
ncbi:MAG: hypothetical protein J0H10_15895 [Alphaproteobacteria bacterium]|nr:hypothetical protein [Alphaproteobacteria bacterium]